jgi:hypothetical protein
MSDSKTSNDLKPYKPNEALALILICIAYVVPLGLWFSVVYSGSGGIGNSLLIFAGAYGIAFLIALLYYRMGIQDDVEAKIDKITGSRIKSIALTTFASFLILFITIFILAVNPDLIKILENSVGIWILGVLGYSGFMKEIFKSEVFSKLKEESDNEIFNYDFLLTCFDEKNIGPFVEYFKKDCSQQRKDTMGVDFPFDFTVNFENEGQLTLLEKLVKWKKLGGYFTWIYLTSLVSLIVTIISITMKTI